MIGMPLAFAGVVGVGAALILTLDWYFFLQGRGDA